MAPFLLYNMGMDFTEEIFRLLDDGNTTLIFPTENTARHYLSKYVRARGTSVLASRAMAFDEFKVHYAPVHERRPANKYHRLSFISDFLTRGSTGLDYLYRASFFSYRHRFVPFLSRILPKLSELEQTGVSNDRLYRDLQILRRNYQSYLDSNGLFEPGWERCDVSYAKGMDGDYVLVGYDADIPMQQLMADLGDVPNIKTLSTQCSRTARYEKFFTEEAELETLFQRLEELKVRGVPTDDIIISTPNMDGLKGRLERKAREYNVPLSFMRSLSLSETVPGRYLFAIMRCINEDLSFRSLENLLLNTALPYCDMEANRALLNYMIEHNRQSGSFSFTNDPLFVDLSRNPDARIFELYKVLKNSLNAIRKANDGDELIKDLHGLTDLLLGQGEFRNGEAMDRDVYAFIFSELGAINRTLKESGLRMESMFSIFMSEVQNLSYVPQEKRTGIKVYQYGQDHLLDVPYHFLIGLNDGNCHLRKMTLDFLEDHEVSGRTVLDITDSVLACYMGLSRTVHISGSETSYGGAQSVPTFFILRDLVQKMDPQFETIRSDADVQSLEQASETSLAPRGPDLAKEGSGHSIPEDQMVLSYSSISNYAQCPYLAYLKRDLTKKAIDEFEPAKQDDAAIGEFLHKVIQTFMKRHFNTQLVPQGLEDYHGEISEIMDQMLGENDVFEPTLKASIRGQYLKSVQNILDALLVCEGKRKKGYVGPFIPLQNEYRLTADPHFTGFVDTIIKSADGDIYLLDYKKGSADPTYQLVLYKYLYDKDPPYGEEVLDCFFYSMKDSCFKGFDDKKWHEQSVKLENDIKSVENGYMNGNWVATPSKDNCKKCRERAICRRRFNLQ